jgi:hypothetical protein
MSRNRGLGRGDGLGRGAKPRADGSRHRVRNWNFLESRRNDSFHPARSGGGRIKAALFERCQL